VIELLALRIAEATYGLPLPRIAEISLRVRVHAVPEIAPPLAGFARHRGQPVPVVDMRRRLGYPLRSPRLSDHFVFARTSRRLVALAVDRVLTLIRIDREAIHAPPASAAHVAGVLPTRDGLLFIADLDAALSLEEDRAVDDWLRGNAFPS
jgi:purine-binding chemotaxis protein CheW